MDIGTKVQDLNILQRLETFGSLTKMLHYDPKKRMKLQEVFSNAYLSKDVSQIFKIKHKNSLIGAIRIFTGGKSDLSSALFSKEYRQKGSMIMPISETIKTTLKDLKAIKIFEFNENLNNESIKEINKAILKQNIGITNHQQHFTNKNAFTCTIKNQEFNKQIIEQKQNSESEQQKVLKLYIVNLQKYKVLEVVKQKLQQINYKSNKEQIIYLSKYCINIFQYISLLKISQSLTKKQNYFKISQQQFKIFIVSNQFDKLNDVINEKLLLLQKTIRQLKFKIQSLDENDKKLADQMEIKHFMSINFKNSSICDIKICYRKILKISYDTVTKQFNKHTNKQRLARLAMYIVYALTMDKLYIDHLIEENFKLYFQWAHEKPSSIIHSYNLKRYIDQAPIQTLVLHAKFILQKYFKI